MQARIGEIRIRCDNLVVWLEGAQGPPAPPPAGVPPPGGMIQDRLAAISHVVKEVYAEGTVLYSHGEEWIRAESLFLDLANHRGIVIDAVASFPFKGRDADVDLVVKADELRILAEDRVQARGVSTTTCSFGHPHFHLASSQLEIVREPPGVQDPGTPQERRVENYHLEAEGNVLHAGAFPVLWLPDFVGDTAQRRPFSYVEDVRLSRSRRFGYEFGVTIGDDIEDGEGRRWGHWSVPLDWYSKRGPGAGVDLVYGGADRGYRGTLRTRYQRDHGDDRFFGEPGTKNRGRISLTHRHLLPWEVQLDLELSLFSDRGYYPTWFEDQDKGEKPPENLIYLKKAFFNSYLTGLYTTRFNDWETVVEYQPELEYDLVYEPLFDLFGRPLYLGSTLRFSHNRLEVDEDLDVAARGTWRADADSLLEYPFPVGPLTLTPFAGLRYTWYEEDLFERRDEDRIGFTHGATLAMQAWRVWDASGGLFDLDGLRHVVYPEITFRNTIGVELEPDELVQYDQVDAFDDVQAVELRARNLLQTVRQRDTGPAIENIVDLDARTAYFPNAGRDHGGDPWSDLELDLIVRFSDALQMAADAELDWYGKGLEVANYAVGYVPSRAFQAFAGVRHFADTYDAVFAQANWRIEEKWMVTVESSYDFKEDRGIDHRFVLTRFAHDWVLQAGFRADVGENDYSFTISVEPRLFFNSVLRPGIMRSEPRLLYLGSGLTN